MPVDVYVNGDYAFTFSFGETRTATLPADEYTISVTLAGDPNEIMGLGPVVIPEGVSVSIRAQLSGNKTPALKVNIK